MAEWTTERAAMKDCRPPGMFEESEGPACAPIARRNLCGTTRSRNKPFLVIKVIKMAEAPRTITREEVASHAKKSDCWVVIDNAVLDVTAFLDDHPGGPETVVALAGQDATAQCVMTERGRHSP